MNLQWDNAYGAEVVSCAQCEDRPAADGFTTCGPCLREEMAARERRETCGDLFAGWLESNYSLTVERFNQFPKPAREAIWRAFGERLGIEFVPPARRHATMAGAMEVLKSVVIFAMMLGLALFILAVR